MRPPRPPAALVPAPAVLPALAPLPAASSNPALTYLTGLTSEESKRVQRLALIEIARILTGRADAGLDLPWHELRAPHVTTVKAALVKKGLAVRTCNRMLAALRGVFKESWRAALITGEEYERARDVGGVSGKNMPRGRMLDASEVERLAASAEGERVIDARDLAILGVLVIAGLRRSEVVALDLVDWDTTAMTLRVRHGKGRKERVVPLAPDVKPALDAWRELRGEEPGPLFTAVLKSGRVVLRRLHSQSVYLIAEKLRARAGLAHLSPHDFRRTMISNVLSSSRDLAAAQRLAGHASPTTTTIYDRRGAESDREAVQNLKFPLKAGVK